MYLHRFGLRREPFSIAPDPRLLFLSERHREALAHLRYGAQGGGGFVLLTGAIGAGKTTVCRAFLEQLPANCRVAYVFNPQLSSLELLQTVCEEFGIDLPAGDGAPGSKAYVDALNRFLLERHAAGDHCLLLIDEAQCLAPAVLEQLRLLTNLETSNAKLLQIMLVGQPELREMLADPKLEQLAQRVIARYHLEGLSESETAAYVAHRLTLAGWQGPPPFDAKALRALHRLSDGVPRRVNLLADRSLLALYARGQERAGAALLETVANELRGEARASPPRRWPWLAGASALLASAVLAANWWSQRELKPLPVDAPAPAAGHASAAPMPAAATVSPAKAPQTKLPAGFASPDAALHALAPRWGLAADALPAQPCAPPAGEWRCWTARLSLPALRALDRPGVISLLDDEGRSQPLLLLRLEADSAWLQGPGGEPQPHPLLSLANRWGGDYLTLWRAPPGLREAAVPPDGELAAWLDRRLEAAGVPAQATRSARVATFQRAEGLQADGRAGPLTLMRLAHRADPQEPRLQQAATR
ncbi:MAG: ExeA family protein [Inhella sp.]